MKHTLISRWNYVLVPFSLSKERIAVLKQNAPARVPLHLRGSVLFYLNFVERSLFVAEKQSNKERLKEITAGIEIGIQELFQSDRYRNYLSTMSKFHRYSLNNVMLIHSQMPDATLVAGRKKWETQFQRKVLDSERSHGIEIIAPASSTKPSKWKNWTRIPSFPSWAKMANLSWKKRPLRSPISRWSRSTMFPRQTGNRSLSSP